MFPWLLLLKVTTRITTDTIISADSLRKEDKTDVIDETMRLSTMIKGFKIQEWI